jgi:hypothetical protein
MPLYGLSVPQLAALAGLTHTRVYQMIHEGTGPRLSPIHSYSPLTRPGPRRERVVAFEDALRWLEARATSAPTPSARAAAADGLLTLKVRWITQARKSGGVPRLPWLQLTPAERPRLVSSFTVGRFRRSRARPAAPVSTPYEPRTDGLLGATEATT